MADDKSEGLIDKVKGRLKKTGGDVADDPQLKREGGREENRGEAKEELGEAKEQVEEKAREVSRKES